MSKQTIKPSSFFLAAFCFLALLIFNLIEDNFYSAIAFFSLFFLTLVLGLNHRFNLLKNKGNIAKKSRHHLSFGE